MAAFDLSAPKLRKIFAGVASESKSHDFGVRNAHPFAKFAKGYSTLIGNGFHKFQLKEAGPPALLTTVDLTFNKPA